MGTRSNGLSREKVNGPLTRRGPASGQSVFDAVQTVNSPARYNRETRLAARSLLRKQAKHIRKHIPRDQRSVADRLVLQTVGGWV